MGKKTKKIDLAIYQTFFENVLNCIQDSQYEALLAANQKLISLYWDIGEKIVEAQAARNWGTEVVSKLAEDIQKVLPGIRGFSSKNLWRMRKFYTFYVDKPELKILIKSIAWTHNLEIMTKCQDNLQCEFYIRMTIKYGWTKNVLVHQIENRAYEKTLSNQTNFDLKLPKEVRTQAKLAVKDEYVFDFLDLGDKYNERALEKALILNVESFLYEIGNMFTFVGSQYRLEINDKEYFIDILLYHRRLRSLIAIELKIGTFLPEYIGKMQFYLALLDDTVRLEEENPSIGIILCKSKDKTVVEYALRESKKPIGVATYTVTPKLPKELETQLPTPEQIAKLLKGIEKESQITNRKSQEYNSKILSKAKQKVIEYLDQNKSISNQQYQKLIKVSKRQASKELKILVDEGILLKVGTKGPGTYYTLDP